MSDIDSHQRRREPQEDAASRSATASAGVVWRAARAGLWGLPAYGLLLGLSTLTHQPSIQDFDAYARYITTDIFLASHLVASIFGAGLAIVGVVALTTFLARGRAVRGAVVGLVLTTITQVFMAAAFGSATFVQPGIGRAHLRGVPHMPELNLDTAYGPTFVITALTASFFLILSAVIVGVAMARTSRRLRWYGIGYPTFVALFTLSGFFLQPVQALSGFALAAVTAALAVQLPRLLPRPADGAATGTDHRQTRSRVAASS
jgi:hypothetical protein